MTQGKSFSPLNPEDKELIRQELEGPEWRLPVSELSDEVRAERAYTSYVQDIIESARIGDPEVPGRRARVYVTARERATGRKPRNLPKHRRITPLEDNAVSKAIRGPLTLLADWSKDVIS